MTVNGRPGGDGRQQGDRSARGGRTMIVAPHAQAGEAGNAVLKAGGNAIEALIAAGAALSVVYPHFCGLGGDAVWMLSDANGAVTTLLGIGQSPEDISGVTELPARGAASTLTSACLVESWGRLLALSRDEWGGTRSLAQLLEQAILLAEDGFTVSPSQRFWFDFRASERQTWQASRRTSRGRGCRGSRRLAARCAALLSMDRGSSTRARLPRGSRQG